MGLNPNAIAHLMPILYCVIGAPLSDGVGHMRILPSFVTLGASGTPSANTVVWNDEEGSYVLLNLSVSSFRCTKREVWYISMKVFALSTL